MVVDPIDYSIACNKLGGIRGQCLEEEEEGAEDHTSRKEEDLEDDP